MGFFSKIKAGLKKSTDSLSGGLQKISTAVISKKISEEDLQALEEVLITSDLGIRTATTLCDELRKEKPKIEEGKDLRHYLAEKITARLEGEHGFIPAEKIRDNNTPFVMFVMGANGCGKTTSIAKLAEYYKGKGLKVLLAAGDLFRAAGSEQLAIWGRRLDIEVVSAEQGGASSGLIFDAHKKALAGDYDLLIIDTAGRLHNKNDLMAELEKLNRVLKKQDETAPHAVLLVLDATSGKNAISLAEAFHAVLPVDYLLLTKLDGTAKGGILVALNEVLSLPIMAVGVGEKAEDLLPFEAESYVRALLDLPEIT